MTIEAEKASKRFEKLETVGAIVVTIGFIISGMGGIAFISGSITNEFRDDPESQRNSLILLLIGVVLMIIGAVLCAIKFALDQHNNSDDPSQPCNIEEGK